MAQAIRPIRSDFRIDHRSVRPIFDSTDVRSGKCEARSQFLRRRTYGHEILQPAVEHFHDGLLPAVNWPRCTHVENSIRTRPSCWCAANSASSAAIMDAKFGVLSVGTYELLRSRPRNDSRSKC